MSDLMISRSGLSQATTMSAFFNGSPVELWTCNGGSNQQWKLG